MYLFKKQRDAFGLCVFSDKLDWMSQVKSTNVHLFYLYAELEKAYSQPKEKTSTNITQVLHQVAGQIHQRSMVIIFSDMFENSMDNEKLQSLFAAIQHLKYSKHEVVIFNVTDKHKEMEFGYDSRPHHFIDMENGEQIKVHPNKIRNSYLSLSKEYHHMLELKCAQYQIDLVDAYIEDGYNHVLKSFLIKRNKMV